MRKNVFTLNMPAHFAVLDETEMTYVVGGWDKKVFDTKWQAAEFLDGKANHCNLAILGGVGAMALAAYLEEPVGVIIGAGIDYIMVQWKEAYREAAKTAKNLSWSNGVIVTKESYAGVIFIDFYHVPYCS